MSVYLNNASWLAPRASIPGSLVAHRGVHQTFTTEGLTNVSYTATMIYPPEHEYLENTIASIAEAFRLGAHEVEIDIHRTMDDEFAVFHDWGLDCRTEGAGVTREHTMAHLKTRDIGYGYTADCGRTFSFRGKGIGLMPTLYEVLESFPGRRFSINTKSNDPIEGNLLAARLARLNDAERDLISLIVGGNRLYRVLRKEFPTMPMAKETAALKCLKDYLLWGWSGFVPASCRDNDFSVPQSYSWMLWGYPDRLRARMNAVGVKATLLPPYYGGIFDPAFDSPEDLEHLPSGCGIITNKIEIKGPAWHETY
jgi:glycerophosphoryl diester phosphodiesterase